MFELVRGGFDVFADLTRAFDNSGDEVDPVLREVVAVAPFGVAIDAVGMLQGDRVDGELLAKRGGVLGIRWDHIEPVDEAGIDLGIEMLPGSE